MKLAALALLATSAFAATATFPTTTLATALTGWPAAHQPATVVYLASNAAFVPGTNPVSTSGIGDPVGHTDQILMVDMEAMCVTGDIQPGGGIPVNRGCYGSPVQGHSAGATVWVGYPSYYPLTIPTGPCIAAQQPVLPVIYIENAGVYDCVLGNWVYTGLASHAFVDRSQPVWHIAKAPKKPWYRRFWAHIRGK